MGGWETSSSSGGEGSDPSQNGGDGWETSNEVPPEQAGDGSGNPSGSPNGGDPGGGMPGQSPGDAELEEALGSIDGEILAERAVIESRSNENPNNPGVPAGGGAGGQGSQNDGQASSPVLAPTNRTAPPPPQPGRSNSDVVPDDLPDAKDDDIIARQLREAAMQETDPELREKLWEEYRRYKGA
jgi:hypothetical protein